jgi:hypothetical protein
MNEYCGQCAREISRELSPTVILRDGITEIDRFIEKVQLQIAQAQEAIHEAERKRIVLMTMLSDYETK